MINLILPIIDKVDQYQKMLEEFSSLQDVKIFCGVRENLKDKITPGQNTEVVVYDSKSKKEEIINSLHTKVKESGGLMVVRRPLSLEEFEALCDSEADVVSLQREKNKFSTFWTNLWKKIIKALFAFFYFEDISAIYLKENLFKLVSNLGNLSYITRINKFVGVSEEVVITTSKSPKKEYDVFINVSQLIISILFVAMCVIWSIILCNTGKSIIVMVLLSILIVLISLFVLLISILSFVRSNFVGKLKFGNAEEI